VLFAQPPVRGSLPPWTRGTLDFHQISTGRGNAALVVFPDGTTMLVDAGAVRDGETIADTDPRPNNTRTAGACIADYIVSRGVSRLDYVVLTHFDADHILGLSRCRRAPADRHRDRSRARVLEAPRR
jgi:beta-lactamase superfamily II metal-dependent hydrolase